MIDPKDIAIMIYLACNKLLYLRNINIENKVYAKKISEKITLPMTELV